MSHSSVWHNDDALLKDDGLDDTDENATRVGVLHYELLLIGTEVLQL